MMAHSDTGQIVLETSAPITRLLSLDDLSAEAKGRAPDPSVFDGNPPFFWRAEASSNRVDAYLTAMQPSTLRNFAADAESGVGFQNSHNTRSLGFGRSIAGQYVGVQGDGVAKMMADFYTVEGIRLNEVSTHDFIVGVRSGVIRDVSVGFYGGEMQCSVCDTPVEEFWGMQFPDCDHIPGQMYYPDGTSTNATDTKAKRAAAASGEPVMCIWNIENARLSEVSAVYDGATPGAQIVEVKARSLAEHGRLRPETARALGARYRITLPASARAFAGADIPQPVPAKEDRMDPKKDEREAAATTETPDLAASIRALLTNAGVSVDGEPEAAIRSLVEENTRLRPLADDGRAYRESLLTEALAEGVRAHGTEFAEETYRGLLKDAPLETIKRARDDFKKIGDKSFAGGRATTDGVDGEGTDAANVTPLRPGVPDTAFRAR